MNRPMIVLAALTLSLAACTNNDNTGSAKQKAADTPSRNTSASEATPTVAPDSTQSLAALEKRYALVPSDPALASELAYAYAEQSNPKALRLADSLLRSRTPDPEKAYYVKADYYSRTGNTAEAVRNYDEAIAANIYFLDAHVDKGRLFFRQKNYPAALKAFATGQKISPDEAIFYFWVAKTQEAMGSKADAKMNYERAHALDKTLKEAKEAADRL